MVNYHLQSTFSLCIVLCIVSVSSNNAAIWETTRYGEICYSRCDYYDESYTWCYKTSSWDYCSVSPKLTRYGDVCNTECAQVGENYYWCWINANQTNWEYCSLPIARSSYTTAYYGEYCINTCAEHGSSYNWCDTTKGWDYCSSKSTEFQDWTTREKLCLQTCATHGYSYRYCYYDSSNWDYCGQYDASPTIVSSSSDHRVCTTPCYSETCNSQDTSHNCDLINFNRWLKEPACDNDIGVLRSNADLQVEEPCRVVDMDTSRMCVWVLLDEGRLVPIFQQSRSQQRDTSNGIGLLQNITGQIGTILTHGSIRIEIQGITTKNVCTIQCQINEPRPPRQPTSVAGILVSLSDLDNLPIRFIRNALLISLQQGQMVRIRITHRDLHSDTLMFEIDTN